MIQRGFQYLLLTCCLVVTGTSLAASNDAGGESAVEASETRIFEVFGMDCPGCHGGLEKLVKKVPSVQDAKANWKDKRLEVIVVPGQNLEDAVIYDAIRRANFTPGKRIK